LLTNIVDEQGLAVEGTDIRRGGGGTRLRHRGEENQEEKFPTSLLLIYLLSRDSQLKALIFGGVAAAPDSATEGKKIKKKNSRLLSVESRSGGDDTFRHGPAPSGHGLINCK
jgi:hypothetical protein